MPVIPRRVMPLLLMAPAFLLMAGLFLLPVVSLVARSFESPDGLWSNYVRLVETPLYYQVLLRTLVISGATAFICLLLGYPIAYQLTRSGTFVKGLILISVLIPFWTNLLVRSYGWIVILNPQGVLNSLLLNAGIISTPLNLVYNTTGVLIGMTQIMLPYMILPLYAVMSRLDPQITNAARSLGAAPRTAFVKIYFPMTLPGVMAGTLLVFTISLGFFIVPALLGGARGLMLAQMIEFNINRALNWGMAATLSVTLLGVTLLLYWVGDRWFKLGTIWGVER